MKKIFLFLAFFTVPVLQAGKKGAHNVSSGDEKEKELIFQITELDINDTPRIQILSFPTGIASYIPKAITSLPEIRLNQTLITEESFKAYECKLFKDGFEVIQPIKDKEKSSSLTRQLPEKRKKIIKDEEKSETQRKRIARGPKNKE
ncbi:MAG: hypothetical protein BGO07_02265 [Alphaproteobacteria bacterium 40-19]|nr:MAG: hypothetical protein BGO07_02265 [Alphaproteobacteria bacterium 40-19]